MSRIELPAGHHYALTVDISPTFGGMTASMFQRSRAFVQHTGREVTVLTTGYQADTEALRGRLRERGVMIDGIHLANAWEDIRTWGDEPFRSVKTRLATPDNFEPIGQRGASADPLRRELLDNAGNLVQVDYLREDGSLLLVDQANGGGKEDRRVTVCDLAGEPVGTWTYMFPFTAWWLDSLPRDPVAWMIIESKASANMMLRYDRPDVARLHVVRGSHLRNGDGGPLERELVTSRQRVIENLSVLDSVVFLTQSQRSDVEARFGVHENIAVIPNSRHMPARVPRLHRPRGQGVMLASLDGRKRINHAVRGIVKAQARMPRRQVKLDVWGQGSAKDDLTTLITRLDAPVSLRGHSPTAAEEFSKASFSLLTSRTEALPGVLLESMGRGCIPISYDLPYGPSDIITHGVDGFLVPYGDIDALAAQICDVVRMPLKDLAEMRKAAHRRAQDYNDHDAVQRWADLLASIAERRGFSG